MCGDEGPLALKKDKQSRLYDAARKKHGFASAENALGGKQLRPCGR